MCSTTCFAALMSYVVLYNLLNCPVGVVPVTTVTQDDVDGLRDYKGHYGDSWDANIKEVRGSFLIVTLLYQVCVSAVHCMRMRNVHCPSIGF